MKRLIFFIVFSVTGVLLILNLSQVATASNLYDFVSNMRTVNLKVNQFSASGETGEIDARKLTDILKTALSERKSVKFSIVDNAGAADLEISGEITDFIYLEKDPIDIFIPAGLVLDLLTTQSYARLRFKIKVHDIKKDKIVFEKLLKATITKAGMSREESIPLITKRAAKVSIIECFGKSYSKR